MNLRIPYIVTENFQDLNETVKSCNAQSIILLGPKGCGKTIATVTLLLKLIKSGRTALYITPLILQNLGLDNMMQYTRELIKEYNKDRADGQIDLTETVGSKKGFIGFFMKYINAFCEKRKVFVNGLL